MLQYKTRMFKEKCCQTTKQIRRLGKSATEAHHVDMSSLGRHVQRRRPRADRVQIHIGTHFNHFGHAVSIAVEGVVVQVCVHLKRDRHA